MANFEYRIKQMEESVASLKDKYETARDFTSELLAKAQELGIEAVGIGETDERTQKRPFSNPSDHDLFAKGYEKRKRLNSDGTRDEVDGGCIVWTLARDMGVYAGCGNSDQAQITGEAQAKLVNGIYELKDGIWIKQ